MIRRRDRIVTPRQARLETRVVIAVVILISCLIGLAIYGKLTGAWDRPLPDIQHSPSLPPQ